MSAQARDEAVTSLQAAKAAVDTAQRNLDCSPGQSAPGSRARIADCRFRRAPWTRRAMRSQCARVGRAGKCRGRLCAGVCAGQRQGRCVGGAAGRSRRRGSAHRHHHGPDADLGLCATARDAGRRRATGRHSARSDAERRHRLGQGDRQIRGRRFCHAARREQHEARHQDHADRSCSSPIPARSLCPA